MMFNKSQTDELWKHEFAFLKLHQNEHIFTVTLNRPQKKNALNPTMVNELAFAMSYAHHQDDIRLVLLQAAGDVFCSGADLKAFAGQSEPNESTVPKLKREVPLIRIFRQMHKPCIALVGGHVMAGGLLLLAGCTHVLAVKDVKLSLPEVHRGIFPFQVMAALLEIMPDRKVLDWCIRGNSVSAIQAKEYGLITKVCTEEQLMEEGLALAKEICKGSPHAIRNGLEAYEYLRNDSDEHYYYLSGMLMKVLQSNDAREGIQAFREKRPPEWSGQ